MSNYVSTIGTETKQRVGKASNKVVSSVSYAIRSLMFRMTGEHRLPFEVKTPSESSRKALSEIASGETDTFDSVDELMADLRAED
ncbi:MAG: type II toxin-antitoxin system antitoxin, RelB/DinJ family [Parvularculales bacterium]